LEEKKQIATSETAGSGAVKNVAKVKKSAPADRMMASRFEMKYLISESTAAGMKQFMKSYIPMDRYCNFTAGATIRSSACTWIPKISGFVVRVLKGTRIGSNFGFAATQTSLTILAFLK